MDFEGMANALLLFPHSWPNLLSVTLLTRQQKGWDRHHSRWGAVPQTGLCAASAGCWDLSSLALWEPRMAADWKAHLDKPLPGSLMICARNVLHQSKRTEQKHSGLRLVHNRNRSCLVHRSCFMCPPIKTVGADVFSLSLVLWEI